MRQGLIYGGNSNKNKPALCIALVGFAYRYWSVSKSSYENPVKTATRINNHRLQCLLGGLRSKSCELYNRRDVLDAKELVSVSLREKKLEKLK